MNHVNHTKKDSYLHPFRTEKYRDLLATIRHEPLVMYHILHADHVDTGHPEFFAQCTKEELLHLYDAFTADSSSKNTAFKKMVLDKIVEAGIIGTPADLARFFKRATTSNERDFLSAHLEYFSEYFKEKVESME